MERKLFDHFLTLERRKQTNNKRRAGARKTHRKKTTTMTSDNHLEGKVRWYNQNKGYGFVTDDSGQDHFLHASRLERTGLDVIAPDTRVRFDIDEDRKQPGRFEVNNIELVV